MKNFPDVQENAYWAHFSSFFCTKKIISFHSIFERSCFAVPLCLKARAEAPREKRSQAVGSRFLWGTSACFFTVLPLTCPGLGRGGWDCLHEPAVLLKSRRVYIISLVLLLLGIYSGEVTSDGCGGLCTRMSIVEVFTKAPSRSQPEHPTIGDCSKKCWSAFTVKRFAIIDRYGEYWMTWQNVPDIKKKKCWKWHMQCDRMLKSMHLALRRQGTRRLNAGPGKSRCRKILKLVHPFLITPTFRELSQILPTLAVTGTRPWNPRWC